MKAGYYNIIAGRQIPCKIGRYEVRYSSPVYGESRGVVATQRGGFNIVPSEEGQYRFFEEAEIIVKEDGFIVTSHDEAERLAVTFMGELMVCTMPDCVEEFSISQFYGILKFPEKIQVIQSLSLNGIKFVRGFPQEAIIKGNVTIRDTPITDIPEGWVIYGNGVFTDNPYLKEVKAKDFYGSLCLGNNPSLKILPTGLHVRGDLNLEGCWKLKRLPKDLKVDGDLLLRGTRVDSLPLTAKTGGNIYR